MGNTTIIGSEALLFQVDCPLDLPHQQRFWAIAEEASHWPHVRHAIPGVTNVTLIFDETPTDLDKIDHQLNSLWEDGIAKEIEGERIKIEIVYGGAQGMHLAEAAELTNLKIDELVRIHSAPEYTVYAVGSHAGYCYLGGLDPRLATPRRKSPLTNLPAGSLSMAGLQTGVSASAGPSGWNTIGSTDVKFFDPNREPPALLKPGDRIQFKPVEILA